jgi:hypothetical protein
MVYGKNNRFYFQGSIAKGLSHMRKVRKMFLHQYFQFKEIRHLKKEYGRILKILVSNIGLFLIVISTIKKRKTKLLGFSPQTNYTNLETASYRRS